MINSVVFHIADINQSVIRFPLVGMNNGIKCYFSFDNGLQRGSRDIRHNACIDFPIAFIDAENNCFASGSASSFAFYMTTSEVRFVYFDNAWKGRGIVKKV